MSAPQRFRKKPVEIEAQQYTDAESGSEIIKRILAAGGSASLHCVDPDQPDHGGHTIRIRTLEGDMHAALGDWVIRGVQGEFYPCKPDIFAATHEPGGVEMVEALTYADATQKLTAALRVRVIPEGEPFEGPVIGAVALTTPPEDVGSVATAVREAFGGKVGFEQLPESILPARTIALVDAVVRSRRPLHDGRFVFDPTSNPDLVVVTVELSAVLDHRQVRQIETEGHG